MSDTVRRRPLSTRERLDLFLEAKGQCQVCGWQLRPGARWQIDHVIPLALGGDDDRTNMQVLCVTCHGGKTTQRDIPAIARAERLRASHLGARRSRWPLPGGRQTRWKKTIDGRVVKRQ